MLAVPDFYHPTLGRNLTERENLQNSFISFSSRGFRRFLRNNSINYGAQRVYKHLFGSSLAICRLSCSESLLLINGKKLE